jgi:hypothetical protein
LVPIAAMAIAAALCGGRAATAADAAGAGTAPAASAAALLTTINVRAAPAPLATCHRIDEVNAGLFPRTEVIGYDFSGADAHALGEAMDATIRTVGPDAATIRLVLLFATREAIAFRFGGDGCHTMTVDFEIEKMHLVFERAGVQAPFGSTYYQLSDRAI